MRASRRPTSASRIAVVLLSAAAALSVAPIASAQPKKPPAKSDPRTAEAKRLFDEGAAAYGQGAYEKAIDFWQKSHEISQKPLIFESIANAYERLGDARKAREYLLKWKDFAPRDELGVLETRLKNLDGRIAREDEIEAAKKKAEDDKAKAEQEERDKAAREAAAKRASISVPGLVLIGVGGAAIIAGVSLDIVAAGKRPDATKVCKSAGDKSLCLSSAKDDIGTSKTLALAGDITWAVGAAAAAAGVALVITKKVMASREAQAPPPAAMIVPNGAGLAVIGRF